MIISMYRIAVTNRHLCQEDFLTRIHRLAEDPYYDAILLREKDMTEAEYRILAKEVVSICQKNGKKCILHSFYRVATDLGHPFLHLPLPLLRTLTERERGSFIEIGTSVHSLTQAEEALELGASYVTAGHIFSTDCKPDLPPRGLSFLREICSRISVPVYGIGGISRENEKSVTDQGAKGVCIMSGAMQK